MTDSSTTTAAPAKPETWEQKVWDELEAAEQWAVSDLHEIGLIIEQDVWPVVKSALSLLFSQLGAATLKAVMANIADPALIPAAVGSAIVITASTNGVVDANNAIAAAKAAVEADPTVQALLSAAATAG